MRAPSVGTAPANRPTPAVERLAERVQVGHQVEIERDRRPRRPPGAARSARPGRSSARRPARRPPSITVGERRRRGVGSTAAQHAEAALGRHLPGQHGRQRRLVDLQQHPGPRQPPRRRRRRAARTPSASEATRSRTAPGSRSIRPPIGRSSEAASVHGPATCTLTSPSKSPASSVSASRSRSQQVAGAAQRPGPGATRSATGRRTARPAGRPAARRRGRSCRHPGRGRAARAGAAGPAAHRRRS